MRSSAVQPSDVCATSPCQISSHSDESSVSQLALNTYYHERKVAGGYDWEVHVFPFFSYGETPDGHWWNVLYGLAGYERRGSMTKLRTFWIPIPLSE